MISPENFIYFLIILISTIGFSFIIPQIRKLKYNVLYLTGLRYAIGLGILAYLTFFLTLFHLLKKEFFYVFILIGIILFVTNFKDFTLGFKENFSIQFKLTLFSIPLLIFLFVNFFYSLFYPVFYDSMLYHLAVPNYYFLHNGFVLWEHNFLSNLPLTVEFYYLFLLLGKSFMLSKLINFFSSIAMIIVFFDFYKGKNSKFFILPILIYYTLPQFGFLSSSSKTDITALLFVLLSVDLFLKYLKNKDKKIVLILSAIFSGLAVSSKYINGFYIISMFFSYVLVEKKLNKTILKEIFLISIIVIIILSPWLIKSFVLTGNPVYPYFNKIFQSKYYSPILSENFSNAIKRGHFSFLDLLLYPFKILTKPYSYGMTAVYGYLFITFLIFIFFYKRNYKNNFILFMSLFSFIILIFFSRVPRYFLGVLVLLSVLISSGIEETIFKKVRYKRIFSYLFIFLLLVNLFYQILLQEKFFKGIKYIVLKRNHNIDYLDILPYHKAFNFINRTLKSDEIICFLGEDRTFYLNKSFEASSLYDENIIINTLRRVKSLDEFKRILKKHSITHILYTEIGLRRMMKKSLTYKLSGKERERLFGYLKHFRLIYADARTYKIYKLD